jgi:GTP cyclohydrolase I
MDQRKIETAVRMLLEGIGEDPDRGGLKETPRRVAELCKELYGGLGRDPAEVLKEYPMEADEALILAKKIAFHSICEHHLLPFVGVAHIAYISKDGRVTGLSQLVKVIEILAHRPQIQEQLTHQIADVLDRALKPSGVLVILEAQHLCMTLRGVKKPGARIVTSAARGLLKEDSRRAEVFSQISE